MFSMSLPVPGKLTEPRMIRLLFALCWIAYFSTYIGRLNYSSAMTELIASQVLSRTEAGAISMVFFFCYGGGQLINGFLGDKLSPRWMLFIGMSASALLNALMGAIPLFPAMVLLWGLNGYVQSMIWPPIVRIFSDMLEGETMIRCSIHITSTIAAGTLAAYLLSAVMIQAAGWRMAFWAAAVALGGAALLWLIGFGRVERYALRHGRREEDASAPRTPAEYPKVPLWRLVTRGGLAVLLVPILVHGVLKDGVTSWVPTYISETFQAAPVLSILVTMALPVVNLTGAYAANFMNRRFFRGEGRTSAFFFMIALGALLALRFFGNVSMVLSILLLAVITSSMLAVNTMLINLVPLYFGKIGKSSTVSGFLNSTAYLGAALSTFTIGLLVEYTGWGFTITTWAAITAAALLFCIFSRKTVFSPDNCL